MILCQKRAWLATALICLSATTVAAVAQPATQPATRPAPEERRDRAAEAAKRIAEAMEAGRGGAFSDEPALGTEELSRRVDVVLLLDCSGSMRFALDAARTQFWRIASSIASAEPQPRLRIGLMAYGRANEQFPMVPLSDDLLDVFDQLMTG